MRRVLVRRLSFATLYAAIRVHPETQRLLEPYIEFV